MAHDLGLRMLEVNLTDGRISVSDVSEDDVFLLGGSRGIQAKLLHQVPAGCDPLGEDNLLMFGAGIFAGTPVPSSGRVTVTTKSPATGLYTKSTAGGGFGVLLKAAGLMSIKFAGRSARPVILQIRDREARLVDASALWGKDVHETRELLTRKLGWDPLSIACIGPASENGVKYGAIVFDGHSFAGRTGVGTVMAAKGLKAVAVSGSGLLYPESAEEFDRLCYQARARLIEDPGSAKYYVTGTSGSIMPVNESKGLPSYNFQRGQLKDAYKLSGPYLLEKGYITRRRGCSGCVLSCHRDARVGSGRYKGLSVGGPEYETLSAFGSGCGVSDVDAVLAANEICNRYGMDTISAGSAVQFAMECFEKGLLDERDTGGLELRFGNADAMVAMTEMIAAREGLGRLLGEGVRRAAEEIGGGSYKWAVQAKGLEQSRVETRAANAYALAFAVNPRGPDHLHAQPIAEFGMNPRARDTIRKITGDDRYCDSMLLDKRAEIVRWHEDIFAVSDSMGLCAFTTTSAYGIDEHLIAELLSACFGREIDGEAVMLMGRRTLNVERMFNIREGYRQRDDTLPWRMMNEVLPDLADKRALNSQENLDQMLSEYYLLHGWGASGIPTEEVLRRLGLGFLLDAGTQPPREGA